MDNFGNVQFTGYYTPVLQARHTRQESSAIRCMLCLPAARKTAACRIGRQFIPARWTRLILAWSNSLVDNFMMEVQGSAYIDFGDGRPLTFFGYAGKNGHAYRSIGKVLIDRGEVAREEMSMQAIRQWAERHSEYEVRELLEQNPSFVFFKPMMTSPVKGRAPYRWWPRPRWPPIAR